MYATTDTAPINDTGAHSASTEHLDPQLRSFTERISAVSSTDPTLIHYLRERLPFLSGQAVKRLIENGQVRLNGAIKTRATTPVKSGQQLEVTEHSGLKPKRNADFVTIHYRDADLIVAEKPPGLLTVPFRDLRHSLQEILRKQVARIEHVRAIPPLGTVHRIDKEASGLVVFTRKLVVQRLLQQQFLEHSVKRHYVALLNGQIRGGDAWTISSFMADDRGDGIKGSIEGVAGVGKSAVTHFRVLKRYQAATLVECRLETGRTHQIRIHAAEMGHPIAGESVYVRDYRNPPLKAPRLMLHAASLGFLHPLRQLEVKFEAALPDEMEGYLELLE